MPLYPLWLVPNACACAEVLNDSQELVAAPTTHWIHDVHNDTYYKRPDNPMFGHVLERVWSVAFDCFESWRTDNCYRCDEENGMQDCGRDACQCYDDDTS